MTDTTAPRPHRRLRRSLLGVSLVASALAPLTLPGPSASAAPPPASSLGLTEVSGTRVARGGAPGAVRAVVTNHAGTPATGVQVRYRMPAGLEHVVAASSPGCSAVGALVTCEVGDLAPGAATAVEIALREPLGTAVLGTRSGSFLPPTSDGYDPAAGEVLQTTWYHDAGAEGTDLAWCWPVDRPSPNMDVAGGTCDGTADVAPLDPDEIAVLDEFPAPFSESLVRSWEFETQIVAPATGSYRACGTMIDDGGYLAIAPIGRAMVPADTAVTVLSYDSATGAPFPLVGGERYRVVMRVSNRGFDGIDNGANGGTLAGWDAYGIAPASEPCGVDDATVFGTADSAWIGRTVADVVVVGSSDLGVLGAVESAAVDGQRRAVVRVANTGLDPTSARLSFRLPPGARVTSPADGCDRWDADSCEIDELAPTDPASRGRVVSVTFSGDRPGIGWNLTSPSTIDADPGDDEGQLDSGSN